MFDENLIVSDDIDVAGVYSAALEAFQTKMDKTYSIGMNSVKRYTKEAYKFKKAKRYAEAYECAKKARDELDGTKYLVNKIFGREDIKEKDTKLLHQHNEDKKRMISAATSLAISAAVLIVNLRGLSGADSLQAAIKAMSASTITSSVNVVKNLKEMHHAKKKKKEHENEERFGRNASKTYGDAYDTVSGQYAEKKSKYERLIAAMDSALIKECGELKILMSKQPSAPKMEKDVSQ